MGWIVSSQNSYDHILTSGTSKCKWWSTLHVNLTGLRDGQEVGKTLFLNVSVSFWKRLALGRPNKEVHHHQYMWASSNPLKSFWVQQKGRREMNVLSVWTGTSICCPPHWCSWFLGCQTQTKLHQQAFLVQADRRKIMGFLSLCNHMSQFFIIFFYNISFYITYLPISFDSLENPNTVLSIL